MFWYQFLFLASLVGLFPSKAKLHNYSTEAFPSRVQCRKAKLIETGDGKKLVNTVFIIFLNTRNVRKYPLKTFKKLVVAESLIRYIRNLLEKPVFKTATLVG